MKQRELEHLDKAIFASFACARARNPGKSSSSTSNGGGLRWEAVEEVWPRTRGQRCWVHKTANVLNKLPKSQQSKAKRALQV